MAGSVKYIRSAFGQSLGGGRHDFVGLGSADNNLNLDWSVVNQEAVELLESLASTGSVAESDVGDSPALGVGAVDQLNPLDRADRLNKVFLWGTRLVNRVELITFAADSISFSMSPVRPKSSKYELDRARRQRAKQRDAKDALDILSDIAALTAASGMLQQPLRPHRTVILFSLAHDAHPHVLMRWHRAVAGIPLPRPQTQ